MYKRELNLAIYGQGLLFILIAFLYPVHAEISSGNAGAKQGAVSREEFEALKSDVKSIFEAVDTKMDLILNLLAKDGPFAETFRGPQGERGVQGPPGPVANATEILARLEELENFQEMVEAAQKPLDIYFGTDGGGIQVYSERTNQVKTFVASTEDLEGVAWDEKNQQLYYCSHSTIYRVNRDGTQVQAVFNSTSYGSMWGLALDWISGKLYGVSLRGFVFVCKTTATGPINCETLLTGQGTLRGITLDPNRGTMYYATRGSIKMAQMDGTNVVEIITGLSSAAGVAVDLNSLRLFWVDHSTHKVQSSNLDGTDVQQVAQLPSGTYPWGIAVNEDRLYWGNWDSKSLQVSTKTGQNVQTLYSGTHSIQQLVAATSNPKQTRPNHCEGQSCSGICVLNKNSFRCIG